ncbi:uncharacterized protein LOC106659283 [Trichogramma pretiosum]|uniref:uncharacterized protein LOC106659283 n=1 Tax=Trichogramma pretiosum TaxID=7493 RepID=UPI0006C9CEAD|nr:uncharacterized protein LOC106659283 [Trichogramma pretiosum]XP_014237213.1 uncharacterized protein LOC106659283 [Trichogramma pretiosum]
MKLRIALITAILAAVLGASQSQSYQNYNPFFYGFAPYIRPVSQLTASRFVNMRDPRANTGPILFPPGPPSDPRDTSGVIVGGSGYGFVPPNAGNHLGRRR